MLKNALAFAIWFGFCSSAIAFEEITEEELAASSAQDGVSVMWKMDDNGVRINSIALIDKNGIDPSITTGYNNAGKLIFSNVGFKTCSESAINGACTSLFVVPTLRFDIDAIGDHNGNGVASPMLNVNLTLGGGANKFRFYIDNISIANNTGGAPRTLMTFGGRTGPDIDTYGHYIDIVPQGSNKTILNMQLGFQRDNLITFTNGNFGTIDVGTVSFIDATNTNNSLRFGLKLEQFDITNLGVNIAEEGLQFSQANFGGGLMDVTMSDIKMGGSSAASIGTIGLQNISIANLVVTVAGKN